jgi:hypothetical protein
MRTHQSREEPASTRSTEIVYAASRSFIGILNHKSQVNVFCLCFNMSLTVLDDPVFLGPVSQRGELGWRRFVRCLKMRVMVRQNLPKCHSIAASASWIGAALE